MIVRITGRVIAAAVLATALGLTHLVWAHVPLPPDGGNVAAGLDTSGEAAPAAEPISLEMVAQPCCPPDEAGFDAFCLPDVRPCGDSARLWLRGQYLLWWTKGNRLPALVSTSPQDSTWDQAGVPDTAGFDVLFGNQSIANENRGGGWLTLGYWLNDAHTWGLQFDWFLVGNDKGTDAFAAASEGAPILARPFYDAALGHADAAKVAFPDVVAGSVGVSSSSELNSGSVLLRKNWRSGCRGRIDLLGGYRYFGFREDLIIAESRILTTAIGVSPADTTLDSFDRFATDNEFHGGELGLSAELDHASWSLNLLAKLALGNVHQQLTVDGSTTIVTPSPNSETYLSSGGLFSQPTNIGYHSRNSLGVLPELGVSLQYHLTERLSLSLGYNLVCLSRVLRTGDQIDTTVNSTQLADFDQPGGGTLAGPPHPAADLRDTGFWAQGIGLGVQLAR